MESVLTGPLFSPWQSVIVWGAGPASPQRVRADDRGRIAFTADSARLTPSRDAADEQSAAAADPDYFVTREVRFAPAEAQTPRR